MAQVTIPSGPKKPLDAEGLSSLLRDAFLAVARDVRDVPVETASRLVFRTSDAPETIHEASYVPWPEYRRSIWAAAEAVRRSPEVDAVIDYIWNANALPQTISQDGDGIPDKGAWALAIGTQLIQSPFVSLCTSAAAKRLSTEGTFEPWTVDTNELNEAATDIAKNVSTGSETIKAQCPLIHTNLSPGTSVEILPGVRLRSWTIDELCVYLTQHHNEYLPDDLTISMSQGVLEIKISGLPENADDIARAVIGKVDLVKWALMAARNDQHSISESAILLQYPWGWNGQTIRRSDVTYARGRMISIPQIDSAVAMQASVVARRALALVKDAPELDSVLWFLGRSLIAPTSRDSLLEAAIGLESLLVPDPGESTYKFCLHGTALLSAVLTEDPEKDLKAIYTLRSKAAHGADADARKYDEMATRARFLLCKAILAAVQLTESGQLRPSETGGDLAKAARDMVKRRCTTTSTQECRPTQVCT